VSEKILKWIENANIFEESLENTMSMININNDIRSELGAITTKNTL